MNRRDFLKLGTFVTGGLLAAPFANQLNGYVQMGQQVAQHIGKLAAPYQSDQVPQIHLTRASRPIPIDGKWKDDWNNPTLVNLYNYDANQYGSSWEYSGQSGFAYSRLMDDDEWVYGNAEYLPPPDANGKRAFDPGLTQIFIDSLGKKDDVPQEYDFVFGIDAKTNQVSYSIGTDNAKNGYAG